MTNRGSEGEPLQRRTWHNTIGKPRNPHSPHSTTAWQHPRYLGSERVVPAVRPSINSPALLLAARSAKAACCEWRNPAPSRKRRSPVRQTAGRLPSKSRHFVPLRDRVVLAPSEPLESESIQLLSKLVPTGNPITYRRKRLQLEKALVACPLLAIRK